MKNFNIAIFGCGTVGGGVAKIILEMNEQLNKKSSTKVNLAKIVEPYAAAASTKYGLPEEIFCGGGKNLTKVEANAYIDEIINDGSIDLIVETIGGSNDFIEDLAIRVCKAKKHLVTANKALLAERGTAIFDAARENNVLLGFEAAVCGAIPIIKTIKESFTGDTIQSISGIMNGTSNYILSQMQDEGLEFYDALKLAQEKGYAEADPTLDINGGDASHKIIILMKLAYGIDVKMEQLAFTGIQEIEKEDIEFAKEIGCNIKLICHAELKDDKVYASVCPMMVKYSNPLSYISGSTNAVMTTNKYSGMHMLVGKGAGSSETASSIVADIVFSARYQNVAKNYMEDMSYEFLDINHLEFPYIITFESENLPGITGKITTAIGNQKINIDTVSHNRYFNSDKAIFSIATTPCTMKQLQGAIDEILNAEENILISDPKIIPILY